MKQSEATVTGTFGLELQYRSLRGSIVSQPGSARLPVDASGDQRQRRGADAHHLGELRPFIRRILVTAGMSWESRSRPSGCHRGGDSWSSGVLTCQPLLPVEQFLSLRDLRVIRIPDLQPAIAGVGTLLWLHHNALQVLLAHKPVKAVARLVRITFQFSPT
jgi:hypothetical protein